MNGIKLELVHFVTGWVWHLPLIKNTDYITFQCMTLMFLKNVMH